MTFGAAAVSALAIGIDHGSMESTFAKTIAKQKFDQAFTQATYEKLYRTSKKIRESGEEVNLIISQDSWLSAKRHLNRIHYTSLIEYEPEAKQFIVKDGAHKGRNIPQLETSSPTSTKTSACSIPSLQTYKPKSFTVTIQARGAESF